MPPRILRGRCRGGFQKNAITGAVESRAGADSCESRALSQALAGQQPSIMARRGTGNKEMKRATASTLRRFIYVSGLVVLTVAVYQIVTSSWSHDSASGSEQERRVRPALWHLGQPIPDHTESTKRWWAATNYLQCYVFGPLTSFGLQSAVHLPVADAPGGITAAECPSYFQWIYQDLAPWETTGITEQHLSASVNLGAFRVVISEGRLYADYYIRCFQTRGFFTLWGLILLLEKYPGQVPDVDLMFNCWDKPNVGKAEHKDPALVPPILSYCSTDNHWDIPFPDWSFWGWPETNIDPWEKEGPEIFEHSNKVPWEHLEDSAYWKGNPFVADIRQNLLQCNASQDPHSKVHLYIQDWLAELKTNFSTSDLARHCNHRYNIYAPGNAWSVSYKYIMACGAPVIAIDSEYYEFFTRSLLPKEHYLPASPNHLCSSINSQVGWGNKHPSKAKKIGRWGQKFMEEDLKLDNVYAYMLHLLKQYAKLLKYVPKVPAHAEEVSKSKLLCVATPSNREMMLRNTNAGSGGSMANYNQHCTMPTANPKYIQGVKSKNPLLSK